MIPMDTASKRERRQVCLKRILLNSLLLEGPVEVQTLLKQHAQAKSDSGYNCTYRFISYSVIAGDAHHTIA